jgi:hypothetical protein
MPPEHFERLERIKAVEREHSAIRLAADRLLAAAESDSTILRGGAGLKIKDVRHAVQRLEGTYIIRLFAEFETSLRLFWPRARSTDSPSRTRDLLDGVAATCRIHDVQFQKAHSVRLYRNALVHEQGEAVEPMSISTSRKYLCQFFSFLSGYW